MGTWSPSALADNLPRDAVSIKLLVVLAPYHRCPQMSEMSSDMIKNNGVNGAGTLREGSSHDE